MEGGDLTNESAPRVVIVFEGTLAGLDPKDAVVRERALQRTLLHKPDYKKAAGQWQLDQQALNFVTGIIWRYGQPVDLLTFLHPREAEHIRQALEDMGQPFGHFYVYKSREQFARSLGLAPYIAAVYDFELPGAYGFKGRADWIFG